MFTMLEVRVTTACAVLGTCSACLCCLLLHLDSNLHDFIEDTFSQLCGVWVNLWSSMWDFFCCELWAFAERSKERAAL